ncbi:MAG: ATP-binding cassette domain-containing protein, partial [Myxococcota bacterium]
ANKRPNKLSTGQRQRVALARALMARPRWLLLDEPMAALDVAARRDVRRALSEQLTSHSGPTWLVTHDVRDVVALGAQVCVLEAGRVVQRGPVEALRADPATAFVAEFVGHPV